MNDELSLPTFYGEGEGKFQFIDFPLQESLKIGEFYTLRVRMASNCDIAIINEDIFIRKKEWKYEGNNTYSIKFMPRKVGTINFGLQDHDNHWNCIIEYNIDAPTSNDWNNLKQHYPLNTPTANNIENLYEKEWENAGIDNHKLIELIERHNVKELPIIYTNMGKYFRIISIPMTKKLKKEQSYTFIIKPTDGKNWAIVNGDEWNYDWHTSNDGTLTMTIKPKQSGNLVIYAQFGQDSRYSGCIGYSVE